MGAAYVNERIHKAASVTSDDFIVLKSLPANRRSVRYRPVRIPMGDGGPKPSRYLAFRCISK